MADELQINPNVGQRHSAAYPKGIVNFKDILSERFNKPFESITENEIRSDLLTSGRTRADIRDVIQGFRKFKRRDADFVLEDGGFRINTTAGALKGSGRRKGRTVGQSDLARILRLGEDVSKFAGYAEGIAQDINMPDVIETPVEENIEPEIDFSNIFEGIDPDIAGPARQQSPPPTTGQSTGTSELEAEDEEGPFMDRDVIGRKAMESVQKAFKEAEEPGFFERFGKTPFGMFLKDLKRVATSPNVESKGVGELRPGVQGIDALLGTEFEKTGLGDFISNLAPATPLGGAGSPGIWKSIKSIPKNLKNFLSVNAPTETIAARNARYMRGIKNMTETEKKAEAVAAANKAQRLARTEAAIKPEVKQFNPSQFKTTPSASSTASPKTIREVMSRNTPATETITERLSSNLSRGTLNKEIESLAKAGRKSGILSDGTRVRLKGGTWEIYKEGGKLESKYSKGETQFAAIDPALGNFIWQDQKDDSPLMKSDNYYMSEEGEGYPVTSMKTADDTSPLAYMKRGGKMKKYQRGGLTPQQTALKFQDLIGGAYTEAGIPQDAIDFSTPADAPAMYEVTPGQEGDVFRIDNTIGKKGLNLNDILYYGATVGLPVGKAIQSTMVMNRLKDQLVPDIQAPDLNVGVVRDIRKPDMSIRYNPTTADIGAENANRQFQLAQNRAQDFAFESAQDESKIRQEENIRENQNRQRMMDVDAANKRKSIASQLAAQRFFTELGQRNQAVIGGAETIADIGVQNQYIESMKRLELAKELMRQGKIEEAKALLGIRGKGGKLTKYSNARK